MVCTRCHITWDVPPAVKKRSRCPRCRTNRSKSIPIYASYGKEPVITVTRTSTPPNPPIKSPNVPVITKSYEPHTPSSVSHPCTNCGAPLIPNTTYCGMCGSKQVQAQDRTIYCSTCGSAHQSNLNKCPVCGAPKSGVHIIDPSINRTSLTPAEPNQMTQNLNKLGTELEAICGNCGTKVELDDDFCQSCGAKLV